MKTMTVTENTPWPLFEIPGNTVLSVLEKGRWVQSWRIHSERLCEEVLVFGESKLSPSYIVRKSNTRSSEDS